MREAVGWHVVFISKKTHRHYLATDSLGVNSPFLREEGDNKNAIYRWIDGIESVCRFIETVFRLLFEELRYL